MNLYPSSPNGKMLNKFWRNTSHVREPYNTSYISICKYRTISSFVIDLSICFPSVKAHTLTCIEFQDEAAKDSQYAFGPLSQGYIIG